jgi:hypothetical protein
MRAGCLPPLRGAGYRAGMSTEERLQLGIARAALPLAAGVLVLLLLVELWPSLAQVATQGVCLALVLWLRVRLARSRAPLAGVTGLGWGCRRRRHGGGPRARCSSCC